MSTPCTPFRTLDLFCKVVDNYGDIGICWRLARQWSEQYGLAVRLWVDDLVSFQRICPAIDCHAAQQQLGGVCVRHWRDQSEPFSRDQVADIVIEFFGVDIPPGYIDAMVGRQPASIWLNLEGLTAEEWVEGCHTLSSPHPQKALTKYFFYPGFTAKTGGLIGEAATLAEGRRFQADPQARHDFLRRLGVPQSDLHSLLVSVFCYPEAPLLPLLQCWQQQTSPVCCLIPDGVASASLGDFLAETPVCGQHYQRGNLSLRILPFVAQPDYDRLLWSCDLNFVRGEDSFVRAQWAGKPMIWHIYPQEKQLHHKKLRAFLDRYAPDQPQVRELMLAWNAVTHPEQWMDLWQAYLNTLDDQQEKAVSWREKILENGDMAGNLLKFCQTLLK